MNEATVINQVLACLQVDWPAEEQAIHFLPGRLRQDGEFEYGVAKAAEVAKVRWFDSR